MNRTPESIITSVLKHFDSKNPLHRSDLLTHLQKCGYQETTDRDMRKVVSRMVLSMHEPIGSNNAGYFWIHNEVDLQEAMRELDTKARSLFERKMCTHRNYVESLKVQKEFVF